MKLAIAFRNFRMVKRKSAKAMAALTASSSPKTPSKSKHCSRTPSDPLLMMLIFDLESKKEELKDDREEGDVTVKKSTSNLLIEQMKKKLAKQNLKKENEDSDNEEDSNEDDEGEEETREEVEEPEVPKFDKKGLRHLFVMTFIFYDIFRNND